MKGVSKAPDGFLFHVFIVENPFDLVGLIPVKSHHHGSQGVAFVVVGWTYPPGIVEPQQC